MVGIKYNTEEQETELNVIKDVDAIYTSLPHNHVTPLKYDNGFWSDVEDEFALSWLGQLINHNEYDAGFNNKPIDLDYDPFAPENMDGYEMYAGKFKDVRNKEHHDFIKAKIDENLQRRYRLNDSDRGLLPALVAGLGDPINYIPIPFVKGIGFGSRFVRGGLISAGLVGATEPIRRSIDPTSTGAETAGYVGGAFALGGLFTGIFGRKIINETITKKGGSKKIINNYLKAHHTTEGRTDFEATGFNYKVGDDSFGTTVKVGKTDQAPNNRYKPVHFDKKKNLLTVDEVYLRNVYNQGLHLFFSQKGVNPLPRETFRTAEDFIKFAMKKEVYRGVYKEFRKGKTEKVADFENRLNTRVLTDLVKDATVDRSTANNRLFQNIEALTNYGKVMKAFRDPFYAKEMQRLSGDFATGMRGNRYGIATENSAMLDAMTNWGQKIHATLRRIDDEFVAYRSNNANSTRILNMNLQKGGIRAGDMYSSVMNKLSGRNARDNTKLTELEFRNKVTQAVGDQKVFDDPAIDPHVKKAATEVRKFYKAFGDDAESLNMFASQGSFKLLMEKKDGVIRQIKGLLDDGKKPLSKVQRARLLAMLKRKEGEYVDVKKQLTELEDGIAPPFTMKDEYFNRIWRRDKILKDPDAFKAVIRNWYVRNPIEFKQGNVKWKSTDPKEIEKRVNNTFNKIVDNEANQFDGDGIAGWGIINGQFKAGVRPLMSRALDIPNKEVMDFIETDITVLMRQYHTRMANAIEITRQFGDRHMDNFLDQTEIRLIMKELKVDKDNAKIDKVLNAFEDEKDKLLGVLNTEDPASFSKRSAAFLRDWASLAFMGKVIFSALVDAGRPIMVNGISRTFKDGIGTFVSNNAVYAKALKEVEYFAPAMEVTLASSRKRYIEDGGQVGMGKGFLNRQFDRVAHKFNQAQTPFYFANLLTPWTQGMKQFQSVISAHRFIEDSIKISKGTASEFDINRMASYGIDEKTAKLIADMPYEKLDDKLFVANANMWPTKTGGQQAARKYRQAIFADVNRTIITPSATDQFNMMHGVFRIDSKGMNKVMNNKIGRFFGYQETTRGGKLNNAYLGLPFQFFSWAVSANRKLIMSGLQGREANAMAGVMAMVSLGMLGDYFKNPRYWVQKPVEEKIIRGVELSGVLGLFGDMNFMLETISGGMFDNAIGVRPLLGQDLRFGDPDMADAVGEFAGAGPSIPLDLLHTFMTDQDYDDKAATIRRLIPLNTLWIWDRTFKNLYNKGAEILED